MNDVFIIIDGRKEFLRVGEVFPDSMGLIITEMFIDVDTFVVKTNPRPTNEPHFEFSVFDIVS